MIKVYTDRGKSWEIINSWWMLLTLVPLGFTSFLSFLYIGIRVKNWRWLAWSVVYLGAVITAFIIPIDYMIVVMLCAWIASIVHALNIRSAYVIQLDVYKKSKITSDQQKLSKIRREAEAKFHTENSMPYFNPPALKAKAEPNQTVISEEAQQIFESVDSKIAPDNNEKNAHPPNMHPSGNGRRIDY